MIEAKQHSIGILEVAEEGARMELQTFGQLKQRGEPTRFENAADKSEACKQNWVTPSRCTTRVDEADLQSVRSQYSKSRRRTRLRSVSGSLARRRKIDEALWQQSQQ